jgi:hypothetical protein
MALRFRRGGDLKGERRQITLKAGDFLYLLDGEITTSVKGETGNGGNITIDPQFVVLNQSSIIAQAIEGHGGNITISANQFLQSADSIVSASSALGISGTIEIVGPRVDLNGALVVLSSGLRSAAQVLRNSCAAQAGLRQSSLVEGGAAVCRRIPMRPCPPFTSPAATLTRPRPRLGGAAADPCAADDSPPDDAVRLRDMGHFARVPIRRRKSRHRSPSEKQASCSRYG